MRIGYSYWGFLGDYKEDEAGKALSTPDGNAAYGGYLISEMQKRGHDVFMMQEDRDYWAYERHGHDDFEAFSRDKRAKAYLKMYMPEAEFPELDILLLEWRFPIPGRNTYADIGKPGFQPDLKRQNALIKHYKNTSTKIVIWDLDYKLTQGDEFIINPAAVLETAVQPRSGPSRHIRVEPPVAASDLLQFPMLPVDPNRKLVYVGSRYERDDVIEEWIKPISERFPQQVEFWGNWTAEYNFAEVKAKWPDVKYCDRITMKDFRKAYGTAVAVPLLAKKDYLRHGFITPRIWEAIIFGTLPIGLSSHKGIEEYLPADLIAENPYELGRLVSALSEATTEERDELRKQVAAKIWFMDASNFVATLEQL